jgi:hypothetical protein
MNQAETPFQFVAAPFLTLIDNQVVNTLGEFQDALAHASDASIFYHTFQTLGRHHFLTEGFSNDFAQWVLASLNRPSLAERLGGIDVRDYVSIAELRADVLRMVAEYCETDPRDAHLSAFEPFYFCEGVDVTAPLGLDARTLAEFRDGIAQISHSSFYHHFIASRLRLQLQTNDFSFWLENSLGLRALATRCNRIDIYANTLDSSRQQMIDAIDREIEHGRN